MLWSYIAVSLMMHLRKLMAHVSNYDVVVVTVIVSIIIISISSGKIGL